MRTKRIGWILTIAAIVEAVVSLACDGALDAIDRANVQPAEWVILAMAFTTLAVGVALVVGSRKQ